MKYAIQYPIGIICGLQCTYCLYKHAWDLLRTGKYEDYYSHTCPFTFEQYQQWRDKHLSDATEIIMELHGGEMSYEGNRQLTLDIIDKSDKEKFSLQTNGLGEREFYEELAKRKDKIERIGFTYHRAMMGDDMDSTNKFEHSVRAMKGMGINVYVKELLFPEHRDVILKNKKYWELQNIEFRAQDFKGEGGFDALQYTDDDVALVHPEYQHVTGEQCACRTGYKNIIIRGYDSMAYAFGGDVLACWHDPTVIGNINSDWYNPNYTINRLEDNTVDVAVAQKSYRGNYPRDIYKPGYEKIYQQFNKHQLKKIAQGEQKMRKPKIRVCVPYPNQGEISDETRQSLNALKSANELDVEVVEVQGCNVAIQRNAGVNGRKSNAVTQSDFDFDYYLSVDADIAFTVDHLRELMSLDKDIVGAAYVQRGDDTALVAGACSDGKISLLPVGSTGVQRVEWVGAGFTLVKRKVFECTPYPWYRDAAIPYDDNGVNSVVLTCEDVGFCHNAAESGFEIYCDCDYRVKHITNNQRGTSMTQEKLVEELNKMVAEREKTATSMRKNEATRNALVEQYNGLVIEQARARGAIDKLRELLAADAQPDSGPSSVASESADKAVA